LGQCSYVSGAANTRKEQVYRINSPGGAPLPVVRVYPGNGLWYGIKSVADIGGGNWDIKITTSAALGAVELHAFAPLQAGLAPLDAYGLRILGPSGEVHFDSTRKPFAIDDIVTLPAISLDNGIATAQGAVTGSTPYTTTGVKPGLVLRGSGFNMYISSTQSALTGVALRVDGTAIHRVIGGLVALAPFQLGDSTMNRFRHPEEQIIVVDLNRYI
jgi:hypothetical protein